MNTYPTNLQLPNPQQLQITWNDGAQHVLTVGQLRVHWDRR